MKYWIVCIAWMIQCWPAQGQQWNETGDLPPAARFEDLHFLEAETGWVVASSGYILKTVNRGEEWTTQLFSPGNYFRSVEFLDDQTGFSGTLDGALFKTSDSGETWHRIDSLIHGPFEGICGLSHSGDHVYGVGIYSEPAYIIRSLDRGETWEYHNMDSLADGLVECQFRNQQVGFAGGYSAQHGAVILKTSDGGMSWRQVFAAEDGYEFVWKIFFVNDDVAFGAIESFSGETSIVKTIDGGETWSEHLVDSMNLDIQGIGFTDALHGWVSPRQLPLYETSDGGLTWDPIDILPGINRMIRLDDGVIYAAGRQVYRYDTVSGVDAPEEMEAGIHEILPPVPNPFFDQLTLRVRIDQPTSMNLMIADQHGHILHKVHAGKISAGLHEFQVANGFVRQMKDNLYYVIMHSHEIMLAEKLIRVSR